MNKYEFNEDQVMTIDIHNFEKWEAQHYLERLLVSINSDIKEIVVIHGYRRGTTLQDLVRKELRSNKIKRRFLSLNPGITSLIIN